MSLPASFQHIVGAPLAGVARLTVVHAQRREFRWLSLLEIALGVVLFVCSLPLILVFVALSVLEGDAPWGGGFAGDSGGGGSGSSGQGKSRFFHYHHDVIFEGWNAQGAKLFSVRHTPVTEADGERLVAAVLSAASRDGVVVYELIRAGGITEPVEVWFGGQPLLAQPLAIEPGALRREVEAGGITIVEEDGALELRRRGLPVAQWMGAIVFLLYLLLLPVKVWSRRGRASIADAWLDARGAPPASRVIRLGPGGLSTFEERDGAKRQLARLDPRELVGLTYSATLGYGDVRRRPESLRALGRSGSLNLSLGDANGHAVRALLVARVLALMGQSGQVAPTHCPFCATLYSMGPSTRCPGCGAPTGQVRESAGALSQALAG